MAAITPQSMTDNLKTMVSRIPDMKSPYAEYTYIDPEYEELAKSLPGPLPFPRPSIQELRNHGNHFAKMGLQQDPGPQEGLIAQERRIPITSTEILVRTYIPTPSEPTDTNKELFPLFFWMHGGGFCVGNLDTNEALCRHICVENQVSVVNVDYRLAPEHPFPDGIHDSFDALKWAINSASELKADPKLGVIIGGASSGANYACAVIQLSREDNFFQQTPITGQVLIVPTTCSPLAIPDKYKNVILSRFELYDAPGLDQHAIKMFIDAYNSRYTPGSQAKNPLVSPLLAHHIGLPPAYFQIAGMDALRDEGVVYEQALRENGVKTKINIYPGVPHGFMRLPIKARTKHRDDLRAAIEWLKGLII